MSKTTILSKSPNIKLTLNVERVHYYGESFFDAVTMEISDDSKVPAFTPEQKYTRWDLKDADSPLSIEAIAFDCALSINSKIKDCLKLSPVSGEVAPVSNEKPWYIKDLEACFKMTHVDGDRSDITAQAYDNVFNIIYKLRRNNQWNELRELLKSLKGDEDQKLLAAIIYQTRIYPELQYENDWLYSRFCLSTTDKRKGGWCISQDGSRPFPVLATFTLIESDKSE